MTLLIVFVGIVAVGDLIAVGIGEVLDRFAPQVSLPVFLILFFAVFYFGWQLALRLTEPRKTT
jgi:hypothetical protein